MKWDKAMYDAMYHQDGEPTYRGTIRGADINAYRRRRDFVLQNFNVQKHQRILIAGCGFGWLVEAFLELGYDDTWGVDNSEWIQEAKYEESRVPERILGATTSKYDWIITEYMMDTVEWGDAIDLAAVLENMSANPVVHFVATDPAIWDNVHRKSYWTNGQGSPVRAKGNVIVSGSTIR